MLFCPVCGKSNPGDARNCSFCGASLQGVAQASYSHPMPNPANVNADGPVCPKCRRSNRQGSLFCAHCGYRLTGTPQQYGPNSGVAHKEPITLRNPIEAEITGNIPPGTVLKRRYRILRKVAQGGMGAVYESADSTASAETRWAVKEISPAALPQAERTQAIADFRREAQMLATLHHPNLPQVVETFDELGKHFLVMEFIRGRTLLNALDSSAGFLPQEEVTVWARQLLDVMQYLHSQDPPIIYRDLKPANVMLVESTELIKLIDFGIARFHRAGKSRDTEAFGTAGYAPPEQYGKGQTDQRSDIYALAATLHHLLTRQDPSLNPFNWLPARRFNPAVSPQMEAALQQALSLDPQRRFPTIKAFADAIGIDLPRIVERVAQKPALQAGPQPVPPVAPQAAAQPVAHTPASTPVKATASAQPASPAPATAIETEPTIQQPPSPQRSRQSQTRSRQAGQHEREVKPGNAPATITPRSTPSKREVQVNGNRVSVTAVPLAAHAPILPSSLAPTEAYAVPYTFPKPAQPHQASPSLSLSPSPAPQQQRQASPPQAQPPAMSQAARLMVSDRTVDLGEARWNIRPMRRIQVRSSGGERVEGTLMASQPWIAYNPQRFQDTAVTVEVKVRKRQLHFGRVELQVPNLFAIIWGRTRRMLPLIGCWFWLLFLVASSVGKMLLYYAAGAVGALLVFEGLMWVWAWHVRLLVPAERLNTGRLLVKSTGGDQQIDVRVMARPSWARQALGWTVAMLLLATEIGTVAWLVIDRTGFRIPLPGL
ncbi:MAG: protein kinase [Chloroflexota bacterium]|nr:protein kinase [Chloroflexota bacterium]